MTRFQMQRSWSHRVVIVAGLAALLSGVGGIVGGRVHADDDEDKLLDDKFNDGNIATNTGGVGNGFFLNLCQGGGGCPGVGGTVTEANGVATVSGSATIKAIVSQDPIDPTGTILRWDISGPRPTAGRRRSGGVTVGWGPPTSVGCCTNGVFVEIREDRVRLDVDLGPLGNPSISQYFEILLGSTAHKALYTNNTSSVSAEIRLSNSGWRVRIKGKGVDIDQRGIFGGTVAAGNCTQFNGGTGNCATLSQVVNAEGGTLRALAAGFREGRVASFDRVRVNLQDDDEDD